MKARISAITLGVADLERAVHFYRDGLGLPWHLLPTLSFHAGFTSPALC